LGSHPLAVVQYTYTHKQYTERHKTKKIYRTTQKYIEQYEKYVEQHKNEEECGPCPVFAGFTLECDLKLRKNHGKTPQLE
jgi:hypothetical protein